MSSSVDQLVRIAVLETELKYERAAKEAALASSNQIFQTFSSVIVSIVKATAGENIKPDLLSESVLLEIVKLREQIRSLEEEHTRLKAQLQLARRDVCYISQGTSSSHEYLSEDNAVAGDPETPCTSSGTMKFELNSDICEIDHTDLENILYSSDDEKDVENIVKQDIKSQSQDKSCILMDVAEGISSDPDPYTPTTDTSQIKEFDLGTNPVPGVLKVGSGSKGVFAGEYQIPSKEEVELAILADATRIKWNGPSSHSSSQRDIRIVDSDSCPMFWTYGISYKADPTDKSTFRTVHIGNVSPRIPLEQILEYVRGGSIVSAVLLDSTLTNSAASCLVIFVRASDAAAYVAFVRENPIKIFGKQLEVTLVPSATYPMTQSLMTAINLQQTRCICVRNYPVKMIPISNIMYDMHLWGPLDIPSILHIYVDDEGTLQIRCGSIDTAGRILSLWRSHQFYRLLKIEFCPDPCAGSLSDLLKQRPPLVQEGLHRRNRSREGGASRSNSTLAILPRAIHKANPDEIFLDDETENESDSPTHRRSLEIVMSHINLDGKTTSMTRGDSMSSPGEISWADEMIEEAELEAANEQKSQKSQKPPGLADSIYASPSSTLASEYTESPWPRRPQGRNKGRFEQGGNMPLWMTQLGAERSQGGWRQYQGSWSKPKLPL